MTLSTRIFSASLLIFAYAISIRALDTTTLPTADANGPSKTLEYPKDLREFRVRALKVDGFFAPDIAFTIRNCPKCLKPYVFGVYPRYSRAPYDELAAVGRSIEESLRKPVPKTMYSPTAKKMVARACPYCGEPEKDPHASRAFFCHALLETGDDLQIDYAIKDDKLTEPQYWRVPATGAAVQVDLKSDSETDFKAAFGTHFSLRAKWNEIFAQNWTGDKPIYENVSPGLWFVFRPPKVPRDAFMEFAERVTKPDFEKKLFTRMESPLKIEAALRGATYMDWAKIYADRLARKEADFYVGISLPELRSVAVTAAKSRRVSFNISPGDPAAAGSGFLQRGELKLPMDLAPLVKLSVTSGLSLAQTCSFYMGEGIFALDTAERFQKRVQAILPECTFEFSDGRYMTARDADKNERKIELFQASAKIDPDDPVQFGIYRQYFLRWDAEKARFGPAPLTREVSPLGLPAFIERRIRPAEFNLKREAANALFEPVADANGKRCDLCYTSECAGTVIYVDPTKPRFKDIANVNAARALYFAEGGILPSYIEAQDTLKFPGGIVGLLECRTAILLGTDIASLASDEARATALADFGEVPDDTDRIHFYAFSTNVTALAPRKLTDNEIALVKSRVKALIEESKGDEGLELNLYFDLPRAKPKGKVLRRKK